MSKFSCGVATFIKNGSNQKLQNKTKTRDIKLSFSFLGQLEVGSSALFINERPEQCANTRHQSCQHLRYHLGTALEQQMKDQQGDERSHPYHSIITTGLLLCNCLFVFIKEEQVGSRLLFFFLFNYLSNHIMRLFGHELKWAMSVWYKAWTVLSGTHYIQKWRLSLLKFDLCLTNVQNE